MLAFKEMQLGESLFHQAASNNHRFYFPVRKTVRGNHARQLWEDANIGGPIAGKSWRTKWPVDIGIFHRRRFCGPSTGLTVSVPGEIKGMRVPGTSFNYPGGYITRANELH